VEVNVKKSNNIINKIYPNSIAEEVGIEVGDILISINNQNVSDIIEYKFLMSDEYLEIEIENKDQEIIIYEIEKDYDEDLGIEFSNPIIDKAKSCRNKCMFCFIDQLPKGMRETLYFKDDDSRLSFLQGNFVTLTNMSEDDIDRIIKYRISPINISVHTTNPELRIKMLNNKNASKILDIMKRLAKESIVMNCQIVLCKGINDGDELERTIKDLSELYPYVNSIAVVPAGITKYRDGLYPMEIYDEESAKFVVNQVESFQKDLLRKIQTRFVFLSDEFYIISGSEFPFYDEYEGFLQFEDGVGMVIKFESEVDRYLEENKSTFNKKIVSINKKIVSIATGKSAYSLMKRLAEKIMSKISLLDIRVYLIENDFFGKTITVAGLLTATDLIKNLKNVELGEKLFITRSMMKADEEIFLDDMTLEELEEILKVEVVACQNEGKDFLDKLLTI
jgi:putative radical SAM enzyme (TIGR03279 family)